MMSPKKVLMLHGYSQSDVIFRAKTAGLRKQLQKKGYEFFYPCGPYKLHSKDFNDSEVDLNDSQKTTDMYGWFLKDPETHSYTLEPELLAYLGNYIKENGPFDGIGGFSQGAGLAGYLSTDVYSILPINKEDQPPFKFAMFFSGFKFEPEQFQAAYASHPITLQSLHVLGELDTLVPEERSMKLFEASDPSTRTLLKHAGGHYIPNTKPFINNILSWLHSHTQENPTNRPTTEEATKKPTAAEIEPQLDDDLLDMIDSLGKI
ncbi:unnamed protein product [Kluyveromyces dobzhanskii CBS 2104]|uniref:WGS project CCBQ000000000 data, contig 00099 n=1 Tax=Kluyveromyces dobzhanskii CBS 2104 TaxID=1427455 RepID=A0A0A8L458_9SACH|nr:unnamed protein product [Kluyveromyces dobzhanskii CBS 2104]